MMTTMIERIYDISGRQYGHLTAVEIVEKNGKRNYWRCQCDCGKECIVPKNNLTSGKTKSCGHLRTTSMRMHRGVNPKQKVEITPKQEAWLLKHYCHTKNDEIKAKLGISDGFLHRFARAHGLKKTPQFMRKVMVEVTTAAKKSHLRNGTYPPKGYRIPRSDEGGFKPGMNNVQRFGKKKEAERVRKATESLAKTRKLEKARYDFGLPQRTKLVVKKDSRKKIYQRYRLRKNGYIIARGSNKAYYDENTHRLPEMEARRYGDKNYIYFEYLPLNSNQSWQQ